MMEKQFLLSFIILKEIHAKILPLSPLETATLHRHADLARCRGFYSVELGNSRGRSEGGEKEEREEKREGRRREEQEEEERKNFLGFQRL